MLVSHRFRFIFLKTEKTASSSLYAAFRCRALSKTGNSDALK